MNVMKNRKGMTGLETAIILIAFVITAAAFSFVVLNMGFLSSQKTQTVISSGMKEASSSLMADGDMIGKFLPVAPAAPTSLGSVTFYVRLSQGKEPIDTDPLKLVVSVSTAEGHEELVVETNPLVRPVVGCVISQVIGDDDNLIEGGERWMVQCYLDALTLPAAHTVDAYENFRIEMRPAVGSVLILERNVGAINNYLQVLE